MQSFFPTEQEEGAAEFLSRLTEMVGRELNLTLLPLDPEILVSDEVGPIWMYSYSPQGSLVLCKYNGAVESLKIDVSMAGFRIYDVSEQIRDALKSIRAKLDL